MEFLSNRTEKFFYLEQRRIQRFLPNELFSALDRQSCKAGKSPAVNGRLLIIWS
jgi:hypothetical protein